MRPKSSARSSRTRSLASPSRSAPTARPTPPVSLSREVVGAPREIPRGRLSSSPRLVVAARSLRWSRPAACYLPPARRAAPPPRGNRRGLGSLVSGGAAYPAEIDHLSRRPRGGDLAGGPPPPDTGNERGRGARTPQPRRCRKVSPCVDAGTRHHPRGVPPPAMNHHRLGTGVAEEPETRS